MVGSGVRAGRAATGAAPGAAAVAAAEALAPALGTADALRSFGRRLHLCTTLGQRVLIQQRLCPALHLNTAAQNEYMHRERKLVNSKNNPSVWMVSMTASCNSGTCSGTARLCTSQEHLSISLADTELLWRPQRRRVHLQVRALAELMQNIAKRAMG